MSQANVEIVRRSILGWNDHGVEALVENLEFAKAPHFEAEVEMNWAWMIT